MFAHDVGQLIKHLKCKRVFKASLEAFFGEFNEVLGFFLSVKREVQVY